MSTSEPSNCGSVDGTEDLLLEVRYSSINIQLFIALPQSFALVRMSATQIDKISVDTLFNVYTDV